MDREAWRATIQGVTKNVCHDLATNHTHTHTHVCVHTFIYICTYMHVCIYVCTHICVYTCVCVWVCVHTPTHTFFIFFSIIVYHRILNYTVLYSRILSFIHCLYTSLHLLIPNSQSILPIPTFPLATTSLLPWLWVCFYHFSSVQSLSHVRLFATPWTAARQASLSITNSQSSPKLMSIESVMPSSHLILCRPLLLLPPIPPSIRVFSNESTLRMR